MRVSAAKISHVGRCTLLIGAACLAVVVGQSRATADAHVLLAQSTSSGGTPVSLRVVMVDYLAGTAANVRARVPFETLVEISWSSASSWRVTETTMLSRGARPSVRIVERIDDRLETISGKTTTTGAATKFSLVEAADDDLLRMPNVLTAPWGVARCGPKLSYQRDGPVLDGIRTEVLHRSAVRCAFSNDAPDWNGASTIWFDPRSALVLRATLHTIDGKIADTYEVTRLQGPARDFVQTSAPRYP